MSVKLTIELTLEYDCGDPGDTFESYHNDAEAARRAAREDYLDYLKAHGCTEEKLGKFDWSEGDTYEVYGHIYRLNTEMEALMNHYKSDLESGIATGFDGSVASLVQHLTESCLEEPNKIEIGEEDNYYAWCVENHLHVIKTRNNQVVAVRENDWTGDLFVWGEEIAWKENDEGLEICGEVLYKFK